MDLSHRRLIAVRAGLIAFALALGTGIPASATAAAPELPDLRVSASFGKPTYDALDTIDLHVMVENVGKGVATVVVANAPGNVVWAKGWEPLSMQGARLGPGDRIEVFPTGHLLNLESDVIRADVETHSLEQDTHPEDNVARVTAGYTVRRGDCSGTVYRDANYNGVRDPAESGLPGVTVSFGTSAPPWVNLKTTTDHNGRFAFAGIPAGRYATHFIPPEGLAVGPVGDAAVAPGTGLDLSVPAVVPLSAVLKPAIAFQETSYTPGDLAHLSVTLTNTGLLDLSGITASSLPSQNGSDAQPDWGELARGGAGVSIPAGRTRVFDVSAVVPQVALFYGHLTVRAEFTMPGAVGNPVVQAITRVPGGIGTHIGGLLIRHRGTGAVDIPDTKVYLTDRVTGAIVARAITDAHGRFQFPDLPADLYVFHVVGPWLPSNPAFQVLAGSNANVPNYMNVTGGPEQPDPDPVTTTPVPTATSSPTTTGTPVPSSEQNPSRTAELAQTGTDVAGWSLWALLALVVGLGFVLVARRRPPRA